MMAELTTKIKLKEDKRENWIVEEQATSSSVYSERNYKLNLSPDNAEQYQRDMEALTQEIDQLSVVKDDTEDFVDDVITTTNSIVDDPFRPRNRAERRALEKATRRQKAKKKQMYVDSIKEATKKLAYINMIEKVREMNERIKEEGEQENEAAN